MNDIVTAMRAEADAARERPDGGGAAKYLDAGADEILRLRKLLAGVAGGSK